jgi:hypothetical protein
MKAQFFARFVLCLMMALLASSATALLWRASLSGAGVPIGVNATRPVVAQVTQEAPPTSLNDSFPAAQQATALNVELVGGYTTWGAVDVAVQGNFAYVADLGQGLRIIDIADPANPQEIGAFDTYWARAVAVDANYAYIADDKEGLRIINIAQPANPTAVGQVETLFDAYGVAVAGNMAYLAVSDGTLEIVRISDQTWFSYCDPGCWVVHGRDVAVRWPYVYLAGEPFTGLSVIDVTNPVSPTQVGGPTVSDGVGVVLVERQSRLYAYMAAKGAGLEIIEVTDPVSPTVLGAFDTLDAQDVAAAGNYAYVADGNRGLRVIDVADPTHPAEVGYYIPPNLNHWANGVAVVGNFVYVAEDKAGLQVYWFVPPAVATISVNGGILTSAADNATLTFPAGAFTTPAVITYVVRYPGNVPAAGDFDTTGHVYEVTAVDAGTGQPATLAPGHTYTVVVPYTGEDLNGAAENSLALYYWNGSQWMREPTSVVNTANNTVTATPDHFSVWAMLGSATKQVYLPLVTQ